MSVPSTAVFENRLADSPVEVTIGIPTYKRVAYLEEALESALRQNSALPYEVIVVDNNPERDDETERFMERYRRVRGVSYFKNEVNVGMTGNFNSVYTHGHGPWVVLLHDDDMLYPDYLESIFRRWRLHEKYDLIYASYEIGAAPTASEAPEGKNHLHEGRLEDMLRGNVFGPPSCFAVKRDVMLRAGGFDEAWYPSLGHELFSRLLRTDVRTGVIKGRPMFLYRKGVNESLREETLLQFDALDEKIFKYVLEGCVSPLLRPFWRLIHLHLRHVSAVGKLAWNPDSEKLKSLIADIERKKSLLSRVVFAVYYRFHRRAKGGEIGVLQTPLH